MGEPMKRGRYKLVIRVISAVVLIQLVVGTLAAVYVYDFPYCWKDRTASDRPEFLAKSPEEIPANPQIFRVDSCTTFTIARCSVYPCSAIRRHGVDENELLLQCDYRTDRGGTLSVFFWVREGKWISFANEYVPEGVIVE